ncbi:hypothetical protein TSAR_010862 [Trichomalopsis sarcophagae]|uniref:Uncharacterized protein n=1 Tax=Trichomalopsis sarcophagae TaxID=543379 RepID=A0A232ES98_9HYME|nr:hypothetical protein TSAR_010862 [Trichomalopsis sarcophagae]
MSMKRLAVLSAVHTVQLLQNNSTGAPAAAREPGQQGYSMSSGIGGGRSGRYETDLHGNVNILLGGAMLGGVIAVVFFVCYCCHRNMRKNRPHEYSQYWRPEPDVHSLEVFTMDSHAMCYDRNVISLHGQQIQSLPEEVTASTMAQPRPATPGPPPAYESLIFKPCLASPSDKKPGGGLSPVGCILPVPLDLESGGHRGFKEEECRRDDEGLPSYEAALKLEAHGYV